jgi:stage II sporulation protein D
VVWEQKLSLQEIEERAKSAGIKVAGVTDIRPGLRNTRGRLKNVLIVSSRGDVTVTGDQFRKVIGYGVIKSTNFTVKVKFPGLGNGHGGLCQWGSNSKLDGFAIPDLSYYYPGTSSKA